MIVINIIIHEHEGGVSVGVHRVSHTIIKASVAEVKMDGSIRKSLDRHLLSEEPRKWLETSKLEYDP